MHKKKEGFTIENQDLSKKFSFLEHTADAYVEAYGKSLEEAFENAGLAMFEVMTDIKKVNASIKDSIEVKAHDEYALLYNWLESLLVNFELENILYSKLEVQKIEKISDAFILKATIWGEKFNPEKHDQKVGVKAITYHQMRIRKEKSKVTLNFILDI